MMKYLVEIIPESITNIEAAAARLATTLKLEPAKALSLLKKNPVTKPVSQAEAEKVARLFTKAGIEVFVRAEDEATVAPSIPRAVEPPPVQASGYQSVHSQVQPPEAVTRQNSTSQPSFEETSYQEPSYQEPRHTNSGTRTNSGTVTNPGLKAPSVTPEMQVSDNQSDPDAFAVKTVQSEDTSKIPAGFFTPVPEGSVTSHSADSSPTLPALDSTAPTSNGLGKIAFASILPGLLALAGVFTALYLFGLPLLRSQQRISAETAAISLASSIGNWIGDVSLDNPALSTQLQNVITGTQADLRGRGIELVLLTDAEGNRLSGWYKDGQNVPETINGNDIIQMVNSTPEARLEVENDMLELAAAPLQRGGASIGTVVVGSAEQSLLAKVQPLLTTLLLAGGLPLLLGILISMLVGRNRQL